MACLAACGEEEAQSGPISQEQAVQIGTTIVDQMNTIVSQGAIEQYVDQPALYNGFLGWESALSDIGTYEGVSGGSVSFAEDEVIIKVNVLGSSHAADVEIILDSALATYIGITTNVHYSTGEIMAKAGMNTLIGMGTVFVVLILISLIISCFTFISKFEKRQKKQEAPAPAAAAPVVEQIAAKEELSDDTELVAVIAAAIAAYEGAASTDGFVVRSIRKSNKSKWQNASVYDVVVEEGATSGAPAAAAPAAPRAVPKAAPAPAAAPAAGGAAGSIKIEAGAAGKVFKIEANVGQAVKKGDAVVIVEAMKMEIPVVAPEDGTVASINVAVGDAVEAGALLATLN